MSSRPATSRTVHGSAPDRLTSHVLLLAGVVSFMTRETKPSDWTAEIGAFLEVLPDVAPNAPSRCEAWTAHDLLAHVVAGGEEIQRLVASRLAGEPVPPTRSFAEREAPLVATPDTALRDRLTVGGLGLLASLDELHDRDPDETVPFTGVDLTAMQLMTHVRSELALHRWDLVGDDDVSASLLAQADLLAHGRWVLRRMSSLAEAKRAPLDDGGDLLELWGRRSRRLGS